MSTLSSAMSAELSTCSSYETWLSCMQKLQSLRQSSDQDRSKLEKRFKDRLKEMDVKMKELHRKEKQFCQLERLKARSEETCARLNSDIVSIKQQKVGC